MSSTKFKFRVCLRDNKNQLDCGYGTNGVSYLFVGVYATNRRRTSGRQKSADFSAFF